MQKAKFEVNRTPEGMSLTVSSAQQSTTAPMTPQEARELAAALLVVAERPSRAPAAHMHMGFRL